MKSHYNKWISAVVWVQLAAIGLFAQLTAMANPDISSLYDSAGRNAARQSDHTVQDVADLREHDSIRISSTVQTATEPGEHDPSSNRDAANDEKGALNRGLSSMVRETAKLTEQQPHVVVEHVSRMDDTVPSLQLLHPHEINAAQHSGVRIRTSIHQPCDSCGWLVVRMEADDESGTAALEEWIDRLNTKLTSVGIEPSWTVEVRGEWTESKPIHPDDISHYAVERLHDLGMSLDARITGEYADHSTWSISGFTPLLPYGTLKTDADGSSTRSAMQTKSVSSNIQLALHQHTETGIWQLALGYPALSGEFFP